MTKENIENTHASLLDLDVIIVDENFRLGLYDKRDAFPFSIVRMPHRLSNKPPSTFY